MSRLRWFQLVGAGLLFLGIGCGIAVRRDLPVTTVPELIAYAKANPGKLNFATAGTQNISQLAPAQARRMIFLTGGVFDEDAERFLQAHQRWCMGKPFDPAELRVRMHSSQFLR